MEQAREGSRWRWEPRWSRLGRELSAVGGEARVSAPFEAPSPSDERRLAELRKPLLGVVVTLVVGLMAAMALWRATGAALGALQPAPAARQAAPAAAATRQPPAPSPTAGSTQVVTIPIAAATATPAASTSTPAAGGETPAPTAPPTRVPATPAPPATATTPTTPTTPAPVLGTTARVHVVERGDTLYSIARRNGTTVGALVTANGLGSAETPLSIGRQLVIP